MEKINWFVRGAIILLITLILSMIGYKYFFKEPIADISTGIITLLCLAIILALSEAFDNFSLGKIFSLSRKVQEKEKEIVDKDKKINKVEEEKRDLINQFFSISNNFSQRQSNANFYGFPLDAVKQFIVKPIEETEEKKLKDREQEQEQEQEQNQPKSELIDVRKRIDLSKVEDVTLEKYIKQNNVDISKMFKKVKLYAIDGLDPVSNISPIFDAYINDIETEIFIEVKTSPRSILFSPSIDKLYVLLSKIYHYRQFKKNNSYLLYILVDIPNEDRNSSKVLDKIYNYYSAAITNGLLKIVVMKLEGDETEKIYIENP